MNDRFHDSLRLLALTLLAVAIALAALSHLRGTLVGRAWPTHTVFVRSEYGKQVVHAHPTDFASGQGWRVATWPNGELALSPGIGGWWRYGGFSYARGGTAGGNSIHQLAIPYWPLAVISAVAWALAKWAWPSTIPAVPPAASGGRSLCRPR
jgi:hypothetical protein